ncbi:MAG: Arc family DNA-binding protein [Planctomycetes bacterium]|nr:Arc family DNA-binding protein [Planctomycetota bacterium]
MSVPLTIERLPDGVAAELRRRAAQHNHSVDDEVLEILQASLGEPRRLTIGELAARARASGLRTPSESAAIVREARDARYGR